MHCNDFKKIKYPLPVFLKDPLQRKRKERGGEVGELLKSWSVKARLPSTDIISANGIELQRPENAAFRILQRIVIFYLYHIIRPPNPTKTFHKSAKLLAMHGDNGNGYWPPKVIPFLMSRALKESHDLPGVMLDNRDEGPFMQIEKETFLQYFFS